MARSVVTPVVEDLRLAGHDVNEELVLAHRAEQQIPRSAVKWAGIVNDLAAERGMTVLVEVVRNSI